MTETDLKTQRQADFLRKHTLTEADVRRMIAEKFERAEAQKKAIEQREARILESR